MTENGTTIENKEAPRSVDLTVIPESQRPRSFGLFAAARADTPDLIRELKEKADLRPEEIKPEDIKWGNRSNYDPVLEEDSRNERKSYWEEKGKGFSEALVIWKSEFKRLVNGVNEETEGTKAAAIKSIMLKSPEGATAFV